MFESLEPAPADAILKLIAESKADARPDKVDLGIGVYFTEDGRTPVLNTVKKAEARILETQETKAYLGTAGSPDFNAAMRRHTFATDAYDDRLVTVQAPGGSGSLRLAAGLLYKANPGARMWVSEPTWANHVPLLGSVGFELQPYPYYDTKTHKIDFDGMLAALKTADANDLVVLHACCHNPSGMDLDEDQWRAVADVIVERELVPLVDMAYQGFARGLDEDAFSIRHLATRVPEMVVSNSCSKNFGLYRDRTGSLSVLCRDSATRDIVATQLSGLARTLYSMPPDHGAAIVATILNDEALYSEWVGEVAEMRDRLRGVRALLNDKLKEKAPGHDFSHLVRATGMFCFLGLTPAQVEQVKIDHGVYMVASSRINVAGITQANVDYLAAAIAATL